MTTPTGSLAPETLVHGRYRVVRQIGRGGMGAVYEAVDTRLGSTVALKQTLVRGALLEDAFAREARLLSSLRHPALPVVSDYFAEDDGHFLVMQFIPGVDLAALMAQRSAPFSFGEVLPWADHLLDALDYLHTQAPPIVHRDIKPQNLKLTPRGEIVLLDFGLAKGGTTGLDATPGASLFGYTPQYAPLEQIQATGTDPRSDLYSLAATLYALLANGAPPNALERASAVLQGGPDPLSPLVQLNPQAPRAVGDLLARCMALSPAERPASAAAVRAELAAAVRTGSAGASTAGMSTIHAPQWAAPSPPPAPAVQARPASPPPPPQPALPTAPPQPGSRGCAPLALIALVGALLVASLGGTLFFLAGSFARDLSPDGPPPSPVAAPTLDPREDAPPPPPTLPLPTVAVPDVATTLAMVQATTDAAIAEAQATAQAAFGGVSQQPSPREPLPGGNQQQPSPREPLPGTVELEFGEGGTGDGFLDDPRGVAVGPGGEIYVSDYSTRRIQRFSPRGAFERSFFVEDETPILALAADRQGRVFVSQGTQVSLFEGATGRLLGAFADGEGHGFEDLFVLGDGSLVGIPWASDDLVFLSPDGAETGRLPDILASADVDGSPVAVAADGLGTLYVMGSAEVFIFGRDGAYRDKFTAPGGDFFPDLAVDGQGRVYVTAFMQGVQVFEADGRPAGTIRLPGVAFDLTFDTASNLYAATNAPRVVKVRTAR